LEIGHILSKLQSQHTLESLLAVVYIRELYAQVEMPGFDFTEYANDILFAENDSQRESLKPFDWFVIFWHFLRNNSNKRVFKKLQLRAVDSMMLEFQNFQPVDKFYFYLIENFHFNEQSHISKMLESHLENEIRGLNTSELLDFIHNFLSLKTMKQYKFLERLIGNELEDRIHDQENEFFLMTLMFQISLKNVKSDKVLKRLENNFYNLSVFEQIQVAFILLDKNIKQEELWMEIVVHLEGHFDQVEDYLKVTSNRFRIKLL
jgi:hypothetical protein